jgi:hypothetical protein
MAACPSERLSTGCFFFDRKKRRTHLLSLTRETEQDRRALWNLCETLTAEAMPKCAKMQPA